MLGLLVAAALVSACQRQTLEIGGDLALTVTTNSPVSVTDSLIVTYDVVGRTLLGLVVEYGDAQVDSVSFVGSQTAGGSVANSYAVAGDYVVTARVIDAFHGTLTEQVNVTVQP